MSLALKLDRQDSLAGQLGHSLLAQMRYQEAADAFRLAAKEDPYCAAWWLGLARCLITLGRGREAMNAYVKATDVEPYNAQAHNELGCLEKHPRLAEDAFRGAVKADPESAVYRANLAVTLFRQWRFDEAEACFRKAMRLAPHDPSYAIDLGHMLVELGRFSGAKEVFRRIVRGHEHEAVLTGSGWHLYDEHRYDEAEMMFARREESELDGILAWAYQGFGLALRKLGEARPAIVAFRAAISLRPVLAVFHRDLGDALAAANRARPAAAAYERARQLGRAELDDSQRGWTIALRTA